MTKRICVITGLSHEDSEAITDPINTGWRVASSFWEIGDACALGGPFAPLHETNPNAYGPILGGDASAGTFYTQLINGHRYYTQSEWSDGNDNCEMRPSPGRLAPRFTLSRPHRASTPIRFNPASSTSTHRLSSATWNFGDGSPTKFLLGRATLTAVRHRYQRAGSYTVALILVDDRGNLHIATHRVVIKRAGRASASDSAGAEAELRGRAITPGDTTQVGG